MATRESLAEFRAHRRQGMDRLLAVDHLGVKRYLALDSAAYREGALDAKTKELLGLVASAVLRCDACITYHLETAVDQGWTDAQIVDALNVALVVGGTITVPHIRDAMLRLDEIRADRAAGNASSHG
jgi:AhpD family alkylhydroperoxidase